MFNIFKRLNAHFILVIRHFLRSLRYQLNTPFYPPCSNIELLSTGFSRNIHLYRTDDLYNHFTRSLQNLDLSDFSNSKKSYWINLIPNNHHWYESIFLNSWLKSNTHLFVLAESYLRAQPVLVSVNCQYSIATTGNLSGSQYWHKDFDDHRIFKVFCYLSDVSSPDFGPFEYIPLKCTGIFRYLPFSFLRFITFPINHHSVPCLGPPETSFVCDTARLYHRGSICKYPRLAFWLTFTSPNPLYNYPNDHFSACKKISYELFKRP